ncbi:MAG: HD-GYP domain-containing protein [Lachnospiraceae bacterium]|nr:HD-GYP domain-containing protein [Lachnospiraceae bacterium]
MFFTNGGVEGGTPIWLLLGTIYIAMILDGKLKYFMLILNAIIMIICWIIGYYNEDLIIEYSRFGNYFDSIAGLFIVSVIVYILITFQINLYRSEEQQKNIQRLFEQTATALVNAIDAKDKYTHGHSSRVAEYSRRIAEKAGKSRKECDEIYYIALLHDVGKIGVPEGIINKEGKLTEEEYDTIKAHTDLGAQILQSISEYPYLSIGAHFHHERYDGKGYPQKLKGSDIPEIARIISVADAYDAMTSKRSYRDPIPQQKVREELVKGIGTQFDPDFARYMVHFIDLDLEYDMQEKEEIKELAGKDELIVSEHRSTVSDGILLNTFQTIITMKIGPDVSNPAMPPKPSLLLFDALDARYHDGENEIRDLLYFEYGEIRFDGTAETKEIRKIQTNTVRNNSEHKPEKDEYRIEGLKIKDHLRIRIIGKENIHEIIMALPDSTRYAYLGLTGEYCHIDDVRIEKSVNEAPQDTIPRIAEEISYINVPAGDVPNVQIDGYRTAATDGIPIKDGMQISFHAFGLPTARLVWHCPFINIFDSDDGKVNGPNYHDYTLMRLDGECWEGDPKCSINLLVNKGDDFNGWDAWKKQVKEGIDCTVNIERKDNVITVRTENAGISIKNVSTITDGIDTVYVALTGDQCALTNIRIKYQN